LEAEDVDGRDKPGHDGRESFMTETNLVLLDIDERGVARVVLNRPERNDAYDGDLIQALLSGFDTLEDLLRLRRSARRSGEFLAMTSRAPTAISGPIVGEWHWLVMAGLVPAIHAFLLEKQDVDARNKCGHDGFGLFCKVQKRIKNRRNHWLIGTISRHANLCAQNRRARLPSA
jgi:hypothetical protein